jgi:transposase
MRTGRPKAPLILTPEEQRELESVAHRSRSAPALARRARMVLACAAGQDNNTVARRLRTTPATVGKWRTRFVRQRLAGLYDEPRPGVPRSITDDQIEQVVIRTLESTPRGATHWSTRAMAQATGLSHMAISRIWRGRFDGHDGLKPAQADSSQRGHHFPVTLRCSFRNPLSARGPAPQSGHLRGDATFVQKHQLFRGERAEGLQKRLPPLLVGWRIPLARME